MRGLGLRSFVAQAKLQIAATARDNVPPRDEGRPPKWVSAALLLGVLAACQPPASTGKSISGGTISYSEWTTIKGGDSYIFFAGDKQPEIRIAKTRTANNEIINQILRLKTDSYSQRSYIYLQMVEASGYWGDDVDEFLRDKSQLDKRVRKRFPQATIGEVKSRENEEGEYIYSVVEIDRDERCVIARQGFDTGTAIYTVVRKPITATVYFQYCSNKSGKEILDIFDSIRIKD